MHKFEVHLVAIGNELTTGKIVDTNSAYLARGLLQLGLEVTNVQVVPDREELITSCLRRAVDSAAIVFTTGGLGPTTDDLTRQVIAAVAGEPLEQNDAAREKLVQLFAARKRPMNENNLRQVLFPRAAKVINNRIGTADAFVTSIKSSSGAVVPVISLPGVPRELEVIFTEELTPWLKENFPAEEHVPVSFSWRCFGCSESYLGRQIESCNLPASIEVAYRPMFPEVLLTFNHVGVATRTEATEILGGIQPDLVKAIGDSFIIAKSPYETLPEVVSNLLRARKLQLAVAESCTGGLIGHLLTALSGASDFFTSSVVSYSNDSKSVYLGVRPALLHRYGAVSKEVAIEMARGARFRSGADIGVSVTGIAGPDGGSAEKPVGTFYIGMATKDLEEAWLHFYPQERTMFQRFAAYLAIDLIRRGVLGHALTWERK